MSQTWQNYGNANVSGTGIVAITPNDTTVFDPPLRQIRVGGVGNVAIVCQDGTSGTILGCLIGEKINYIITQVKATGTTATNLTGSL